MLVAVDPLLHEYVFPPDALSVVASPAQSNMFPEIEPEGTGETVIVTEVVSAQLPDETITE